MSDRPILYIVIPCYNEQEVLPITAPQFRDKLLQLERAGIRPATGAPWTRSRP